MAERSSLQKDRGASDGPSPVGPSGDRPASAEPASATTGEHDGPSSTGVDADGWDGDDEPGTAEPDGDRDGDGEKGGRSQPSGFGGSASAALRPSVGAPPRGASLGPDRTSLIVSPPTQRLSRMGAALAPTVSGPDPRPEALSPTEEESDEPQIWVQRHRTPSRLDPRLVMLREPDSWRAACYRVLRHRLEERGNPRTIAVSSAERREGKTTCAVNLACALSECGRARVLLIEGNLRYPALATLFGYAPPTCFSAQLERHKQLPGDPWSVVEVYSPALHVAAMEPENGGRPLVDGPAFAAAMRAFKRAPYDYILVDTPSVLDGADVNLIEDSVDGVLLCSWARRSSARALRRAVEQLAPGKVLGVTLLDA